MRSRGLRAGLTRYGDDGFAYFLRRSFIKAAGYGEDALSRLLVGIAGTTSDYNPCHATAPSLIAAVKRGVLAAGGLPLEFPTISLHESFAYPSSMFYRNLMSMDTEEMVRAQPMDAVVLIGGCDKTVPAQLMGAVSVDIPALSLVVGPMLSGSFRGERIGACTDCRRLWASYRAGEIDEQDLAEAEGQLMPTHGTCLVMGTASTMAILAETLGFSLPGSAAIPAVHSDRLRMGETAGHRAVAMARDDAPRPSRIFTPGALRNAMTVLHALGGSTNALIHLAAIAGRAGLHLDLDEFDAIGRDTPVLLDLKPSGSGYMQDFHAAGGVPAVLLRLRDRLDLSVLTADGRTLEQLLDETPETSNSRVIRPVHDPVHDTGAMAVLSGNLCPNGAVIKVSAASPKLLQHEGPAVVFDSLDDLADRIDSPDLEITPDHILVLRNTGPVGAPGMPEAGGIPIPKKLSMRGVKDMVRISDARMSGTAYGTIVLHASPEAAVGGPLSLVRNGDLVKLDVAGRRLDLLVAEDELQSRAAQWSPPVLAPRGYARLYAEHVMQAEHGCDFDFLQAGQEQDS